MRGRGGDTQHVLGGSGGVFATQHGDVYVWKHSGDPDFRVEQAELEPVPLSASMVRRFPSRLLATRHEVVDLVGRSQELAELAAWATGAESVGVRVIHGVGGQGKTRLANRFARDLSDAGWVVAQARHRLHPDLASGAVAVEPEVAGAGLLVVVDYAERWPVADLQSLLKAHLLLRGPVRVLLLARDVRGWWRTVSEALLDAGVEQVDEVALAPLANALGREQSDAGAAFQSAAAAFARHLEVADLGAVWVPKNVELLGDNALTLHMAALVSVDAATHDAADPPSDPAALSRYLLHRERQGWDELHKAGRIASTPRQIGHASLVAALTQALPYHEGLGVVRATGITESQAVADQLLNDHQIAYPVHDPERVLEPLTPDRLAEDYVALSIPVADASSVEDRDLADPWAVSALGALLGSGNPDHGGEVDEAALGNGYHSSVVSVLVAAAARWPHLSNTVVWPLVKAHPRLVITGGSAVVTGLASLAGADDDLLGLIYTQLPEGSHLEFDQAAALVAERRAELLNRDNVSPARRAHTLAALGYRYAAAGRRREALAPTQEAVEIYRGLADPETGNPAAYLPDLARSLNNLGGRLSEAGSRKEALAPTQEAVDIRRGLADPETGNPAVHLPDLAGSLNNLGIMLSQAGSRKEALAPTQEAVDIYRGLADPETGNPAAYLPDLAVSLNNLGVRLSEAGSRKEALAPTQEAVEIRRGLADPETGNPAAYLPDLASSLNNLAVRLARGGSPARGAGRGPGGRRPLPGAGRPRDRQPRRVPARPRVVAEQPRRPAGRGGSPARGAGRGPGGRRHSSGAGRPRDRQPRRVPARPRGFAEQPGRHVVASWQPEGGAGPDPGGRRDPPGPGRPRDRQPRRLPARPRVVAEQPGQPVVGGRAAGRRRWPRPRRPSRSAVAWPTPRPATPPRTCPTSRCR